MTFSRLDSSWSPCHTHMHLRSQFAPLLCLQVSLSPLQHMHSWLSKPCAHSSTTPLHSTSDIMCEHHRSTHACQRIMLLGPWALALGPLPTCIETSNLSPERNLERMIWERWEEAARVIAKARVETWTEEARATRARRGGQSG